MYFSPIVIAHWLEDSSTVSKQIEYDPLRTNWAIIITHTLHPHWTNWTLNMDSELKTVFLIHGFRSDYNAWEMRAMKHLLQENDVRNVITVDWSKDAGSGITPSEYNLAAEKTASVGKFLAHLISGMVREKLLRERNIHIVGHSLGAHIAGYTGYFLALPGKQFANYYTILQDTEYLKKNGLEEELLGRITGLDPAGPGFEAGHDTMEFVGVTTGLRHLEKLDATFVDVIHTSENFGMCETVGHVDFYPNGGKGSIYRDYTGTYMSGTGGGIKDHSKSIEYFIDSLKKKEKDETYKAYQADSYEAFEKLKVLRPTNVPTNWMGYFAKKPETGKYYLDVVDPTE